MWSFFRRPLERWRKRRADKVVKSLVTCHDVGVRVLRKTRGGETRVAEFVWSEVLQVDTYKLDPFSVDCVCLAFELPNEAWVQVDENLEGWGYLLESVERVLPGFPPVGQWLRKVRIPAFEINHATLWTRAAAGSEDPAQP